MDQDIVDYNSENKHGEVTAAPDAPALVFEPSDSFRSTFPRLRRLLSSARITPVKSGDDLMYLYAWTRASGKSVGWICRPPGASTDVPLHDEHRRLLEHFGGVVGYWGAGFNWLSNLFFALIAEGSTVGFPDGSSGWETGWRDYYIEECTEAGVEPTVDPNDYIVFAVEANSNRLLYHRETASLIMFVYDTGRSNLIPYHRTKSSYYTLLFYRIKGCPDFKSWVEDLAWQWLDIVAN